MTENVVQLDAHENMTVGECLAYCALEQKTYKDVIVVACDNEDNIIVRSSHMSRKDAAWLMMVALDHARGKEV